MKQTAQHGDPCRKRSVEQRRSVVQAVHAAAARGRARAIIKARDRLRVDVQDEPTGLGDLRCGDPIRHRHEQMLLEEGMGRVVSFGLRDGFQPRRGTRGIASREARYGDAEDGHRIGWAVATMSDGSGCG